MLSWYHAEVVIEVAPQLELVEGIIEDANSNLQRYSLLPPFNMTGELNQPLNLTCHSMGNPDPITTWFKNEKPIYNLTNTLEFFELNLTSRGYYRCMVKNHLGEQKSDEFLLNISSNECFKFCMYHIV